MLRWLTAHSRCISLPEILFGEVIRRAVRVVSAMPLIVSSSTLRVVVIEMRERTNGSRISVVLIAHIAEIYFLEPAINSDPNSVFFGRDWADLPMNDLHILEGIFIELDHKIQNPIDDIDLANADRILVEDELIRVSSEYRRIGDGSSEV